MIKEDGTVAGDIAQFADRLGNKPKKKKPMIISFRDFRKKKRRTKDESA